MTASQNEQDSMRRNAEKIFSAIPDPLNCMDAATLYQLCVQYKDFGQKLLREFLNLQEQAANLIQKMFGKTSEKAGCAGQMSFADLDPNLFPSLIFESEQTAAPTDTSEGTPTEDAPTEDAPTGAGTQKPAVEKAKPRKRSTKDEIWNAGNTVDVIDGMDSEQINALKEVCTQLGITFDSALEYVNDEISYTPPQLKRLRHFSATLFLGKVDSLYTSLIDADKIPELQLDLLGNAESLYDYDLTIEASLTVQTSWKDSDIVMLEGTVLDPVVYLVDASTLPDFVIVGYEAQSNRLPIIAGGQNCLSDDNLPVSTVGYEIPDVYAAPVCSFPEHYVPVSTGDGAVSWKLKWGNEIFVSPRDFDCLILEDCFAPITDSILLQRRKQFREIIDSWKTENDCVAVTITDGSRIIIKTMPKKRFLEGSAASPALIAYLIYSKTVLSLPFYRLENEFGRLGYRIKRANMCRWTTTACRDILKPLYEQLAEELRSRDIIHADETPTKCNYKVVKTRNEKTGKIETSYEAVSGKSYFWLYTSGNDGLPPIHVLKFEFSRKAECVNEFLDGYQGYVITDFYGGYNQLEAEHVTRCLCWQHLRRKFLEACPDRKKILKNYLDASVPAEIGFRYCEEIFMMERSFADLSPEERFRERNEKLTPLLDRFWKWIDTVNPRSGSVLEKAISYARKGKEMFMNFLKDGRLEISNNRAERLAKRYKVGLKNFLFHDNNYGGEATAIAYSLVHTAIDNGLDPQKYLETVMVRMKDYTPKNNAMLEELLPWSDEMQKQCGQNASIPDVQMSGTSKNGRSIPRFCPELCPDLPDWYNKKEETIA